MKRNLLSAILGAAVLGLMSSVSATAQTCAAPFVGWNPNTAGSPDLTGTTCGHETGIISVCQGAGGAPAQAFVAQLNIAAAGTFTDISFTGGAGYTISAYLVATSLGCNADASCTTVGDNTAHMLHSDIPPGSYFLILTGADFDSPGACGTFTVHANGTLPVSLQNFTVS